MADKIWTPEQDFPYEMQGDRVVLQVHSLSDKHIADAVEMEREISEDLDKWRLTGNFATKEKARDFIARSAEFFRMKMMAHYALYSKENGEYVGAASLVNMGDHTGGISLYIGTKHRRKGYADEAVALIEENFFALGFEKMLLECNLRNKASFNSAVKLGYKFNQSELDGPSEMVHLYKTSER